MARMLPPTANDKTSHQLNAKSKQSCIADAVNTTHRLVIVRVRVFQSWKTPNLIFHWGRRKKATFAYLTSVFFFFFFVSLFFCSVKKIKACLYGKSPKQSARTVWSIENCISLYFLVSFYLRIEYFPKVI